MPIIDFSKNSSKTSHLYDYCIVGGGVVGLSIATKLAKNHPTKKVIVLESGGMTPGEAQLANSGEIIGNKAYPLTTSRARALGGTQWFWGGNSKPLDPIDFTQRDWVANSGWPITYQQFSENINSATKDLDIDDLEWQNKHSKLNHIKLNNEDFFEHTHFKLSPQIVHTSNLATGNYFQSNEDEIEKLTNLDLLINATVVDFKPKNNHHSFESLMVRNLSQREAPVAAHTFVFAAGAIENARLLKYFTELPHGPNLECKDVVGKYFMEHPHRHINNIITLEPIRPMFLDYFGRFIGSALHQSRFKLTSECQNKYKLNNATITFQENTRKKLFKKQFGNENLLVAVLLMEQEPNIFNHVKLINQKDSFGIPKIELHWQLSEQDWYTLESIRGLVSRFVGVNQIGRAHSVGLKRTDTIRGGHHHMGTTRMGTHPEHSVVDSNCKVWGLQNVYMAGGSVFPTGGSVNPTINMIALGNRLVKHLGTL